MPSFLSRYASLAAGLLLPLSLHAEISAPPGFTALFNGKDLENWFGRDTEDPRKLFAMSDADLKAHWESTMANIHAHWSIDGDELVNDGHGLFLTTRKNYGDFELLVSYKTVPKADSGVYLRGVPQVQIWDSTEEAKFNIGANLGSGGLWNNSAGAPGKDPSKKMDRAFGEWNDFRIVMIGERVTVYLNGEKVVDNAVMENYFDRALPIFAKGPIQLQTHGGEIRWKNVFIREITAEEANKALSSNNEGFQSLSSASLEGWGGAVENYEVADGVIRCKAGHGGMLLTKEEYENFVFRFDFKLPAGGNNGVAVRAPATGDPAWEAFELQILDDGDPQYATLKPYQYHGSVYGLVPAKRGYLRPVGEWNHEEVIVQGTRIQVIVNGTKTVDTDISKIDLEEHRKHGDRIPKGVERTKGYVGFAGHSDPVEFRNIAIKRLD